ncbi:MAG TPA: hypothetical protein VLX92_07020 [Kofleriaceae bacterium]|nr:hypothetical protein [Kofleriaceae bacterium]
MRVSSALALPVAVVRSISPYLLASAAAGAIAIMAPVHATIVPIPVPVAVPVHQVVTRTIAMPIPLAITMPPRCDDTYVGTWVASTYRTEFADWHRYTMHLRCRGDQLVGTLDLEQWRAGPSATQVPACADGGPDENGEYIVARVSERDGVLRVDAVTATPRLLSACSIETGYSLDHFAGKLDGHGGLDMLNNDEAGNAHDRPYHFHRIDR